MLFFFLLTAKCTIFSSILTRFIKLTLKQVAPFTGLNCFNFIFMRTKKKKSPHLPGYNSSIFTEIYTKNLWGGAKGEFYSGSGSYNAHIEGYIECIANFIIQNNVNQIVEIGCGDFNVSSKMLNVLDANAKDYSYIGYDVVKPLIAHNKKLFATDRTDFRLKDAVNGKIQGGDLLIIRQVLQHLDNKSIAKITEKFSNYKYVIVTEHQISEVYGDKVIPNLDKGTDAYNRVVLFSGVYLDKPPFNCRVEKNIYSFYEAQVGLDANVNTLLISI